MDVNREDLEQMETRITSAMRYGFDGLNARLDTLNGRTRTVEVGLAGQQVRIDVLAESVERHQGPAVGGDLKSLGMLTVVIVGALVGLAQGAWTAYEAIQQVIRP